MVLDEFSLPISQDPAIKGIWTAICLAIPLPPPVVQKNLGSVVSMKTALLLPCVTALTIQSPITHAGVRRVTPVRMLGGEPAFLHEAAMNTLASPLKEATSLLADGADAAAIQTVVLGGVVVGYGLSVVAISAFVSSITGGGGSTLSKEPSKPVYAPSSDMSGDRSGPEIFFEGLGNLAKNPLGWISGDDPSPLKGDVSFFEPPEDPAAPRARRMGAKELARRQGMSAGQGFAQPMGQMPPPPQAAPKPFPGFSSMAAPPQQPLPAPKPVAAAPKPVAPKPLAAPKPVAAAPLPTPAKPVPAKAMPKPVAAPPRPVPVTPVPVVAQPVAVKATPSPVTPVPVTAKPAAQPVPTPAPAPAAAAAPDASAELAEQLKQLNAAMAAMAASSNELKAAYSEVKQELSELKASKPSGDGQAD